MDTFCFLSNVLHTYCHFIQYTTAQCDLIYDLTVEHTSCGLLQSFLSLWKIPLKQPQLRAEWLLWPAGSRAVTTHLFSHVNCFAPVISSSGTLLRWKYSKCRKDNQSNAWEQFLRRSHRPVMSVTLCRITVSVWMSAGCGFHFHSVMIILRLVTRLFICGRHLLKASLLILLWHQ